MDYYSFNDHCIGLTAVLKRIVGSLEHKHELHIEWLYFGQYQVPSPHLITSPLGTSPLGTSPLGTCPLGHPPPPPHPLPGHFSRVISPQCTGHITPWLFSPRSIYPPDPHPLHLQFDLWISNIWLCFPWCFSVDPANADLSPYYWIIKGIVYL